MTEQIPDPVGEALAAAVRPTGPDPDGERQARAAFRAARDTGALDARPRRRDDWRPRRRGVRWSVRALVGALFASLAVGGVAVAALGRGPDPASERPEPRPPVTTSAPGRSADSRPPVTSQGPHSRTPRGTKPGHCKAYEAGRGPNRSERAREGCAEPTAGKEHPARPTTAGTPAPGSQGNSGGAGDPGNANSGGSNGNSGNSDNSGVQPTRGSTGQDR
jgi:hypothetical protein